MKIEVDIPDEKIRAAVQEAADGALRSYAGGGTSGPAYRLLKERAERAVLAAVGALNIDSMVAETVARVVGETIEGAVAKAVERRAKAAIRKAADDEKAAGGPLFADRP